MSAPVVLTVPRWAEKRRLVLLQVRADAEATDYPAETERPTVRGDCLPGGKNAQRPCPFASCKHHLYIEIVKGGGLQLNFPDIELWDLKQTCSLDLADGGETPQEMIAEVLNVSKQRVSHVVDDTTRRLKRKRWLLKLLEPDRKDWANVRGLRGDR